MKNFEILASRRFDVCKCCLYFVYSYIFAFFGLIRCDAYNRHEKLDKFIIKSGLIKL